MEQKWNNFGETSPANKHGDTMHDTACKTRHIARKYPGEYAPSSNFSQLLVIAQICAA